MVLGPPVPSYQYDGYVAKTIPDELVVRNMSEGSFEEVLASVQSELISVSLEYSGDVASDIYAYCSTEGGVLQFDPFFVVDGVVTRRHKLPGVDTSIPRQRALVEFGNNELARLREAAKRFNRPLPTQMKLHYSSASRSLDAEYEYEPQYSNHPTLTTDELIEQWEAEVQHALDASDELHTPRQLASPVVNHPVYEVAPPTGATSWAMGFLAYIPIPFLNFVISSVVMICLYPATRKKGFPIASENARMAANWALTVLLVLILMAASLLVLMALIPSKEGFFPIGTPLVLYPILGVTHLIVTIAGTVTARKGKIFRNALAIPFLRIQG